LFGVPARLLPETTAAEADAASSEVTAIASAEAIAQREREAAIGEG
jgi:hypothetical protein